MRRFKYICLSFSSLPFLASLYGLIALIITYPLVFNLGKAVPYFPDWESYSPDWHLYYGDGHFFPWFLWWFKKAIFDLHRNPLFNNYIFAPQGIFIGSGVESLVNILFSLPLQLVFDTITAYNLLIIFNFVLAGIAAFCFTNHFIKNKKASFGAGLYFMSSAYMLLRSLGHFNVQITGWLVFYLLFFIRMVEERRTSDGLFASIFLFLTAISSWYYLFYSFFISLVILAWFHRRDKDLFSIRSAPKPLVLFVFLSAFLMSPFLALFGYSVRHRALSLHSLSSSIIYSSDVLSFLAPSGLSFLFPGVAKSFEQRLVLPGSNYVEKTSFIGVVGLLAILYFLFKITCPRKTLWLTIFVSAYILSLGPFLTVGGTYLFQLPLANRKILIPLPYFFLQLFFPLLFLLRAPNRFSIFILLTTALFISFFLRDLLQGKVVKNMTFKKALFLLICFYLPLESLVAPYPILSFEENHFYRKIRNDNEDYLVLNLPIRELKAENHPYLFDQIFHEKKIVNGAIQYVSYTPTMFNFVRTEPIVNLFNCDYPKELPAGLTQEEFTSQARTVFSRNKIKYIIVHKEHLSLAQECSTTKERVEKFFDKEFKVYEDQKIVCYQF